MTTIDLTPFCAKSSSRYQMDRPFRKDGYLYATDSKIAVRIKDDGPNDTPDEKRKFPAVEHVANWGKLFPLTATLPVPTVTVEYEACKECHGKGIVALCPECDGTQFVECDKCGSEDDCENCSDGTVPLVEGTKQETQDCDRCGGEGKYAVEGNTSCSTA